MAPAQLITTYLEMRGRDEFVPAYCADPSIKMQPLAAPKADFYRSLYRGVGWQWGWRDREVWSDEQLEAYLAQSHLYLYGLYLGEEIGGYVEMEQQPEGMQI